MLTSALELLVDRGEAEAIALAQSMPGSLLLIDDQRARKLASKLGVRFTGTLGILHLPKIKALIPEVRPEIDRLRAAGIHIDFELSRAFLQRIGE
ncbi:MAG: DUF3368 domain-containing protein [Planctomycetes bacterium]|nr:DUF3368 domain-containing protein [Planctomycetota bacterium]